MGYKRDMEKIRVIRQSILKKIINVYLPNRFVRRDVLFYRIQEFSCGEIWKK